LIDRGKKEVKMAKLTAYLVTILGIVLVLAAAEVVSINDSWVMWVLGLGVLIIGIGKLKRNYSKRRK